MTNSRLAICSDDFTANDGVSGFSLTTIKKNKNKLKTDFSDGQQALVKLDVAIKNTVGKFR